MQERMMFSKESLKSRQDCLRVMNKSQTLEIILSTVMKSTKKRRERKSLFQRGAILLGDTKKEI
jgi:hypothetical protein